MNSTIFLSPIFLTATATECVDKKSAKKCNKAKRKGKCNKSWAQRDCQLTCGVCTSGANSKHFLEPEFRHKLFFVIIIFKIYSQLFGTSEK